MSGFELHERINRPHEFVWRYCADTDNVRNWMPDIVSSEKLTEGPIGYAMTLILVSSGNMASRARPLRWTT